MILKQNMRRYFDEGVL